MALQELQRKACALTLFDVLAAKGTGVAAQQPLEAPLAALKSHLTEQLTLMQRHCKELDASLEVGEPHWISRTMPQLLHGKPGRMPCAGAVQDMEMRHRNTRRGGGPAKLVPQNVYHAINNQNIVANAQALSVSRCHHLRLPVVAAASKGIRDLPAAARLCACVGGEAEGVAGPGGHTDADAHRGVPHTAAPHHLLCHSQVCRLAHRLCRSRSAFLRQHPHAQVWAACQVAAVATLQYSTAVAQEQARPPAAKAAHLGVGGGRRRRAAPTPAVPSPPQPSLPVCWPCRDARLMDDGGAPSHCR